MGGNAVHQVEHQQQRHQSEAYAEARQVELGGVEDGDDQHGAQVVHNGQRRQEDLEHQRHALAQQRQYADGEGNVGGHGDAPAARQFAFEAEHLVDAHRHQHSAHGREYGQRGHLEVALALDFEAHHQEEDGHQGVVDPVDEVHVDAELVDGHADVEVLEQPFVPFLQRAVGPHKGYDAHNHQHHASVGGHFDERLGRSLKSFECA